MNRNVDLTIVGGGNVHRSADIVHVQACACGKVLLQLILVIVCLPKKAEVGIVNIDLVAKFSPVEVGGLGGNQTKENESHDQNHAASADSGSARAGPLRLLVFDELDNACKDEQHRP